MRPMQQFKVEQKKLAQEIRKLKSQRKESDCGYVRNLEMYRDDYRHHHIAYCELRGRTREQIEIPRKGNEPNNGYVDTIKEKWLNKLREYEQAQEVDHEALCVSSN